MSSSTDALPDAPFSPELLADLHADALPEDVSSRLWPLVRRDEESMRILAGLDAVSDRLREVGEDPTGTMSIPADVVERIDRTIQSVEQSAPQSIDPVVVPFRSRRRHFVVGIAAAAALLAVGSVVFATVWRTPDASESVAAGPSSPAPDGSLVLDSADLDSGFAFGIIGKRDPGALSDPVDLASCLAANSVDSTTPVLGSSQVRVDGRDGTLLVLAGAQPGRFIALAVGNECGGNNPDILTRRDIG